MKLKKKLMKARKLKRMNEYYQTFFNKLEQWTNLTNITIYNAWDVADTIYVEYIYHKLPSWANDTDVQKNLSDINDLAFHYLYLNNDSQRIRGGPSIQDMWFNMNNSVNGAPFMKVKMYSAHDTTVSAALSFLGINYPHQPKYASALFVDLYKQDSKYFIRVEYLNETGSNISHPYVLNGCSDFDCPFENFTRVYKPRFPASADAECSKKYPPVPPPPDNNGKLILVLVIVIISLVILIFLVFLCVYLRKTDPDPLISRTPSVQYT